MEKSLQTNNIVIPGLTDTSDRRDPVNHLLSKILDPGSMAGMTVVTGLSKCQWGQAIQYESIRTDSINTHRWHLQKVRLH